jgi:hypothetical protein
MKKLPVLVFLTLAIAVSIFGQAESGSQSTAPSDIYEFGKRTVRVPAPATFSDISKGEFDYTIARVRAGLSAQEEMLGLYVPVSFLPRLREKQDIDLDFYAKASVIKFLRNVDSAKPQFDAIVAEIEKNFDTYMDPNGRTAKDLETRTSKNLTDLRGIKTEVDFTGTKNLGYFDKTDRLFSGMTLMNLEVYGRKISVLGTFSVLLVNNRIVSIYTFKMFPGDGDIAALQNFAKQWTAAILAANN